MFGKEMSCFKSKRASYSELRKAGERMRAGNSLNRIINYFVKQGATGG